MKIRTYLLILPIIVFLVQPVGAASRDINLMYKVYVGGFHIADLDVDINLGIDAYKFNVRVQTIGMIGRMFPWWMKAYSRGQISDEGVIPIVAGQHNNWRGKDRYIDIKFHNRVASVDRIVPEPEIDDRDRVPIKLRTGVMDLTSAVIALIRDMDAGKPCRTEIAIFDGRRRYDLIAVPDGTAQLRSSGYSPYGGETVNCRLSVEKKAGFKKNDDTGWNDRERSARIWMAKAFTISPPVPVRLTMNSPIGSIIAHLTDGSVEFRGRKISLDRSEQTEKK